MDIALSSDALDIVFHPSSSSNLLATGLISGKVQLIDFSALNDKVGRSRPGSQDDDESNDDDDDGDDNDDNVNIAPTIKNKGKVRQYDKKWTARPSSKSCRGVYFDQDGSSLYTLSKDGYIFRLDTETGSTISQWKKAHEAAPSRLLQIEPNLLATGDDDGVVSLWDDRSSSSSSAIRSYSHHFDWITSMLWCQHLAPPKAPKLSKEDREKKKQKDEKKLRKRQRNKSRRGEDADDDQEDEQATAYNVKSSRERLVCTSGDGTLSVIDIRSGPSAVLVSEDQEDELLSIASVKQDSKLVVGTQLGILSLWSPTKGLLDHVDRIPGHPASVDAMCTLDHDTVLTGSSDGLVRVVQILPHKLLGIVADHGGLPVERLARKDRWLASIGHGAEVKLTDLSPLLEDDDDDDEEDEDDDEKSGDGDGNDDDGDNDDDDDDDDPGKGQIRQEKQVGLHMNPEEDEEEDNSDEEEDSDADAKPVAKRSRIEEVLSKNESAQDGNQSFFADL